MKRERENVWRKSKKNNKYNYWWLRIEE